MHMPLKSHIINRLNHVFTAQKWNFAEDESGEYTELYYNFSKLLELLSEEEQSLVLDLTSSFQYFPFSRYSPLLSKALTELPLNFFNNFSHTFIVPLKKPKDSPLVKSDSTLLYPCEHTIKRKHSTASVDAYPSMEILKNTLSTRNNSLILFVDDFIGTGDTAISTLDDYLLNYSAHDDEVIILTLVAQESGLKAIKDYGIAVYNAISINRGISDSAYIANKEKALELIDNIEKRLKVNALFKRGYKQSEALVSLVRTPNNTFPLFWLKTKVGSQYWPAPFYR